MERLFDLAGTIEKIFASAGLEYRVVGGLATYLYIEQKEPDAGRLTKDIDIAVRRLDLAKIAQAAEPFGLELCHAAGLDMLVEKAAPSARRAVRLVFAGEKVLDAYPEATPEIGPGPVIRGLQLIALPDLVRMKLTSFRARDEAHVKDLDEAGLVTPEIEERLSPVLRARLAQVRAWD